MTGQVEPRFKTDAPPPAKKKRRRQPEATRLKNKATTLWGRWVHLRDKTCQVCGRGDGKLDAHHIMVRQFAATRTDEGNGVLVCFRCHQLLHSDSMRAVEVYSARLGVDGYAALRAKAYDGVGGKYPADFWRGEVERLTALIDGVS